MCRLAHCSLSSFAEFSIWSVVFNSICSIKSIMIGSKHFLKSFRDVFFQVDRSLLLEACICRWTEHYHTCMSSIPCLKIKVTVRCNQFGLAKILVFVVNARNLLVSSSWCLVFVFIVVFTRSKVAVEIEAIFDTKLK